MSDKRFCSCGSEMVQEGHPFVTIWRCLRTRPKVCGASIFESNDHTDGST